MQKFFIGLIACFFAFVVFSLGLGCGYILITYLEQQSQPDGVESEDFSLFWEVWHVIEDEFYEETNLTTKTTYGAIKGALATLEDPYTIFIEPQPRALEKARLEGQFGGIGAFVRRDEAGQIILEPILDSPSEQAGLLKDDILVAVDGVTISSEMTTDEVVLLIRGEVGTEVSISVRRSGEVDPIDLVITRAVIETPSVEWRILEEDPNIGYIKISLFSNRTSQELDRAFTDLIESETSKYIIDLRGNGGGLLQAALDVSSKFLAEGVILREDRRKAEPKLYEVQQGAKFLDIPIVLLIDGGTASASEIVAGALQDYDIATLVGERTYGKGSVQIVYDFDDQSSIHVTVAKWFTPNSHSIDGVGLTPDIEVLFSEEDHAAGRDPQYLRAIEILQTDS